MASASLPVFELVASKISPKMPAAAPKNADGEGKEDPLQRLLGKALGFVHADRPLTHEEKNELMTDAIHNWESHVNPGFLDYRKSVAHGRQAAAIEWRDGAPGGSTVLDADGHEYIDCLGGFGVFNVGHLHPKVVEAVTSQLKKQGIHSQELLDPLRGYAAQALALSMPPPSSGKDEDALRYSFFTNSGTESVEACLKMAMLATGGRRHFVALISAFHGKSLGSLSATSKAVFRQPFGGALLPFFHVPVNDVAALRQVFSSAKFTGTEIAGVLIEPVLGEGGIHVCSDDFLRAARQACDESGAMLIFDEVQSGMGRTGKMWACEHSGVTPDLMAVGKAFGGGVMPAGACVGSLRAWRKYFENPFLHTTTFGGNPLSMAAALATMSVLREEDLVERARDVGESLIASLRRLQAAHPAILRDVRGRGLMIGLEFSDNETGYAFSRGVFSRKVLLSGTLVNARTIRVEPPLTITAEQVEKVLAVFSETLDEMERERAKDKAAAAAHASDGGAPVASAVAGDGAAAALAAAGGGGGGGGGPALSPKASSASVPERRLSGLSAATDDTDPDPFEQQLAVPKPARGRGPARRKVAASNGAAAAAAATAAPPASGGAGGSSASSSSERHTPDDRSESDDTEDAESHDEQ